MILFFLSPISTNTTTTLLHDDVVFLGSLYIPAMDSMGIENGPAWWKNNAQDDNDAKQDEGAGP